MHMTFTEAPRELGLFHQRNTRLQESLPAVFYSLKWSYKDNKARLFSEKAHKSGQETTVTSQCKGNSSWTCEKILHGEN